MADKKISALTAATTPLAGTEVLPIVQGGSTVKVAVSNLTAGRAIAANGLTSSANIRTEYASAGNVTTITSNTSSGAGAAAQLYNVNDASRALRIQYSSSGGAGGSAMTNGITTETAQIFTDGNYPIVLGTNVSAALILDTSQNAKLINNLIIGTAGKGIDFSANTHAAGMTSELLTWYEEGTWTPADGSGAALSFGNTANNCFYTRVGRMVICIFGLSYPSTADASAAALTGLPFVSKSSASNVAGGYTTYTDAGFQIQLLVGNNDTSVTLWKNTGGSVSNAELSGKWLRGVVTYFV